MIKDVKVASCNREQGLIHIVCFTIEKYDALMELLVDEVRQ